MRYNFEWDPKKAEINARQHKISFERAATVFRDNNALSIPDEEHSESEERWITLGLDNTGSLLVVIHDFTYQSQTDCIIRLISARKATKEESLDY